MMLVPVALIYYFWNSEWIIPLKLLVVTLHEYSHALVAWLTGGEVISIGVNSDQSGYTVTSGGNNILITSAGYIGTTIFGILFLKLSRIKTASKYAMMIIGIILMIMAVLYLENLYGILYGFGFGIVMVILSIFGGKTIPKYLLRFLGIFVLVYSLYDIKGDLLLDVDKTAVTDATILHQYTGIPAMAWAILWVIIVAVVLYYFLLTRKGKNGVEG